jgi:hypothetical protein
LTSMLHHSEELSAIFKSCRIHLDSHSRKRRSASRSRSRNPPPPSPPPPLVSRAAPDGSAAPHLRCQYLYFCTGKASKLSTCGALRVERERRDRHAYEVVLSAFVFFYWYS